MFVALLSQVQLCLWHCCHKCNYVRGTAIVLQVPLSQVQLCYRYGCFKCRVTGTAVSSAVLQVRLSKVPCYRSRCHKCRVTGTAVSSAVFQVPLSQVPSPVPAQQSRCCGHPAPVPGLEAAPPVHPAAAGCHRHPVLRPGHVRQRGASLSPTSGACSPERCATQSYVRGIFAKEVRHSVLSEVHHCTSLRCIETDREVHHSHGAHLKLKGGIILL